MSATEPEIKSAVLDVLKANNAITLASTGGLYSPWVLGAFFAADASDLALYLMLESSGKTLTNLKQNSDVALLVSQNDPTKDFVQAQGTATLLPATEEAAVMMRLKEKMPWFQLYTPSVPVRIDVKIWFISSFSRNWFPAKVLNTGSASKA